MTFGQYEMSIKSQALRAVARQWNVARGSRLMPDWSDIRPHKIGPQLKIIWSYRYDRAHDCLIGRLAGDHIERIFGKTFRNTPMERLYPADQYPGMFARFRRIVREPALYLEEGKVFQAVEHFGYGERVAMPLSRDGVTGDGLIGATVYETFLNFQPQPEPDCQQWFPLSSGEAQP
jgi:hypothetical protein